MCQEKRSVLTDEYLYELYLIEEFTGKPASEVLNDYTLPELMRVMAYLDWMKFL